MELKTFFDNFELLADAPNGVPKLREMILQLAVQGKLVPQDPKDEPASVLLEKIKAEKERLVKKGKIRKVERLPSIKSNEIPYELPDNWEWVRIREICHDLGQKKPDSGFTYIDVSSINNEKGLISDNVQVLDHSNAPSRARKIVKLGTVIYSTVRPYLLNIAILNRNYDPPPIASTAFAVLHPFEGIYNRFLYYYLRSGPFIEYVETAMTGMAYPAINDSRMNMGLVPLPPVDEQKRIITKVDELMALCDELESRKQKASINCIRLNDASLHGLFSATEVNKFNRSWQRICDSFDILYSKPENVVKLRQAILQLAVQGKLVPQDPNDEPASVLLDKIAVEKERLVKEGKIRKSKPLPAILNDKTPHELPDGWDWVKLEQLRKVIEYGTSSKSTHKDSGIPVLRMNNIQNGTVTYSSLKYVPKNIKDLPGLYLKKNDLLFNRTNSYELVGKTGLFKEDDNMFTFASYLIRVALFQKYSSAEYINIVLNSPFFRTTQIEPEITQQCGQANFNGTKLANSLIPMPPLSEQKRIVTKVDELMTICDKLETGLLQSQNVCNHMMEAVVAEINIEKIKGPYVRGTFNFEEPH